MLVCLFEAKFSSYQSFDKMRGVGQTSRDWKRQEREMRVPRGHDDNINESWKKGIERDKEEDARAEKKSARRQIVRTKTIQRRKICEPPLVKGVDVFRP